MPALAKLSDAAIALSKALDDLNVDHGIFGGFAVAAIGGPRESKDIDCAVGCSKEWLVSALSKVKGFKSMGNSRPDLAQFLYGDGNVLVEFSPTSLSATDAVQIQVKGEKLSTSKTWILHPIFLYKGKLQAAATRDKLSDAADLMYLESNHAVSLSKHNNQISRLHVGMALKRYPHLEYSFSRLGIDLDACKALARDFNPNAPPNVPAMNSVQNALLYNLRVPGTPAASAPAAVASSSRQPSSTQAQPSLSSLPLGRTATINGRRYMRTRDGVFVAQGSRWVPVSTQGGAEIE